MAFVMQMPPLEATVQQLRTSAEPRHAVNLAAERPVHLRTSWKATSASTCVFRPGSFLLLGLAALALQQKRKVHRAKVLQCSVTCLDGECSHPSSAFPSQRRSFATVLVMRVPPQLPEPVAAVATQAEIPKDPCKPCKFGPLTPVVPAVAGHFSQARVLLAVPAARRLSSIQPALRVNAARRSRRPIGMHSRTQGVASLGRRRAIRRAVGARLLPTYNAPNMQQAAAFDPSRLSAQLQAGLQVRGNLGTSGQMRGLKVPSSGSVNQLTELFAGHLRVSDEDQKTDP